MAVLMSFHVLSCESYHIHLAFFTVSWESGWDISDRRGWNLAKYWTVALKLITPVWCVASPCRDELLAQLRFFQCKLYPTLWTPLAKGNKVSVVITNSFLMSVPKPSRHKIICNNFCASETQFMHSLLKDFLDEIYTKWHSTLSIATKGCVVSGKIWRLLV